MSIAKRYPSSGAQAEVPLPRIVHKLLRQNTNSVFNSRRGVVMAKQRTYFV